MVRLFYLSLLFAFSYQLTAQEVAEFHLNSCDFDKLEIEIIGRELTFNPNNAILNVQLTPSATQQLEKISRQNMAKPLAFYINNILINTVIIQSELKNKLSIVITKEQAKTLFTTLIESHCTK